MVWGFPIQWEKYISSVVVDFPTSFYNMMKARFKIGCTKFHFQPGQDCPNISEKKKKQNQQFGCMKAISTFDEMHAQPYLSQASLTLIQYQIYQK